MGTTTVLDVTLDGLDPLADGFVYEGIEADPGGECLVPILDSEEGGPSLRERDRGGELPPIVEDTGERTGLLGFAVASAQTSSRRSDRSAWPGGQ